MNLKLLEVVYEGGDILDVALASQRRALREALGSGFQSLDLRGKGTDQRARLLQAALGRKPGHVLVRGLRSVEEVLPFFPKAEFFLDYLAKDRAVDPAELARWAHKIKRVFIYSAKADPDIRKAGVGRISTHAGPFLPDLRTPAPSGDKIIVGVIDMGAGTREVISRMKKVRREQGWDFEIFSTMKGSGITQLRTNFEVAEESNLVVAPMDTMDYGGPHEPALLCMSVGRALCTSTTSAFYSLAFAGTKRYIPAQRYEPGTYATSFGVYCRDREKYDTAFSGLKLNPHAVPQEILERM
jgi:hypothetical protein